MSRTDSVKQLEGWKFQVSQELGVDKNYDFRDPRSFIHAVSVLCSLLQILVHTFLCAQSVNDLNSLFKKPANWLQPSDILTAAPINQLWHSKVPIKCPTRS